VTCHRGPALRGVEPSAGIRYPRPTLGDDQARKNGDSPSPAFEVTLPADGVGDGASRTLGPVVGRYVLGDALGSGGMGVVYRARDPDLDRELAIKLVLPAIVGRRAQERLLLEARAMAKLRHPNVVPVFDVGITEQGVCVVMPLVPGGTLHDWFTAEPRPWRDVVTRFLAAGRGLAAAHAVGIVHRDFKPKNVLLDEDGTVLVADFGLASAAAAPSASSGEAVVTTSVVGTPAYMAPEQAAGGTVDARADQYSFCISFWEGLHGQRPSAAETREGRPSSTEPGAASSEPAPGPPAIPSGREPAPMWLQLAIARGFSDDPGRRWPSLNALLEKIEARMNDRRPDGRRMWVWIAAGVAGASGVAAAAMALGGRDSTGRDRAAAMAAPASDERPALVIGSPRRVTDSGGGCVHAPVFLDDDTVAFDVTRPTGQVDIHTLQLSTGSQRRITDGVRWEWRAGRGVTSNELLYLVTDLQKAEQSYVAAHDLTSGEERRIATGHVGAVTSSGGTYYYIGNNGSELRSQHGKVDERFLTFEQIERTQSLAASPDGRQLAVTGRLAKTNYGVCLIDVETRTLSCPETAEMAAGARVEFGSRGDLYLAGLDGIHVRDRAGAERLIVPGVRAFGGVAVAPGGKTLVYSECTAYGTVREVGVEPPRFLSEEDRLSDPIAGPGGVVAWMRGRREIFVRTADGTVRNLLGPGHRGEVFRSPAFDVPGRQIAFSRSGATRGIWVADIDRSAPERQVTYSENDFFPVFLADGSIVFSRGIDGQHHLFRVVPGQEPTQVLDRPRQTIDIDRSTGRVLLRSPDQKFLYWWDPATGKETPGPPTYAPGTENTFDLSISPDGRWLLYQSGPLGHELWRSPIATWKPELVFKAPESSTMESTAVNDAGHPLVIEKVWHGELFVVDVTRGTL
jgi:Tol biopolymer transport system component